MGFGNIPVPRLQKAFQSFSWMTLMHILEIIRQSILLVIQLKNIFYSIVTTKCKSIHMWGSLQSLHIHFGINNWTSFFFIIIGKPQVQLLFQRVASISFTPRNLSTLQLLPIQTSNQSYNNFQNVTWLSTSQFILQNLEKLSCIFIFILTSLLQPEINKSSFIKSVHNRAPGSTHNKINNNLIFTWTHETRSEMGSFSVRANNWASQIKWIVI